MAIPRIFVSSTCYDLSEIRDNLHSFISNLGYTPIFSDKNDVFYHPDLHSHESCLKEIENCNIFILILGGRFGGQYVYDDTKSIVNAEYDAAKKLNLPIFTFIKREVHDDHRVYIVNKKNKPELYDKLDYPSIDEQKNALKIFNFIDEVRKRDINNAYFTFEFTRNIKEILKKQFAGMFYDFLWKRQNNIDKDNTQKLLSNLTLIGRKTEEIIENIYLKVDTEANEKLEIIQKELNSRMFWHKVLSIFNVSVPETEEKIEIMTEVRPDEKWFEFVERTSKSEFIQINEEDRILKGIKHSNSKKHLIYDLITGEYTHKEKDLIDKLKTYFEDYKTLQKEKRKEILEDLTF